MRKVKFIRALEIEEVPEVGRDEIHYYSMRQSTTPVCSAGASEFLLLDQAVEHMVVPVHRLRKERRGERSDIYIAYSKDAQELLEMPFDVLSRERRDADARANAAEGKLASFEAMTLWHRVLFLFGVLKLRA